jgi:tricarballylate dehydrogenase
MVWLRSKGVRFVPNFGRQSALVDGRRKFFGRLPIEVSGGGAGLVDFLDKAAEEAGLMLFITLGFTVLFLMV